MNLLGTLSALLILLPLLRPVFCQDVAENYCDEVSEDIFQSLSKDETIKKPELWKRKIQEICRRYLKCTKHGCSSSMLHEDSHCTACTSIVIPPVVTEKLGRNVDVKEVSEKLGLRFQMIQMGLRVEFLNDEVCIEKLSTNPNDSCADANPGLRQCAVSASNIRAATCSYIDPCLAPGAPINCQKEGEMRIINGIQTPENDLKYLSWLFLSNGGRTGSKCAGTWVSKSMIVTAKHCLVDKDTNRLKSEGSAGAGTAKYQGNPRIPLTASMFRVHDSIDIGAILLGRDEAGMTPMRLPGDGQHPQVGDWGRVSGWGTHCADPPACYIQEQSSDTALSVDIQIVQPKPGRRSRTTFMAGGLQTDDRIPQDACEGDSGGPVICNAGTPHAFLCGVVSSGPAPGKCGFEPGTYVNVSSREVMQFLAPLAGVEVPQSVLGGGGVKVGARSWCLVAMALVGCWLGGS